MRKVLVFILLLVLTLSAKGEAGLWICTNCDTENNGNFCGKCGSPKGDWVCPNCQQSNTTNFCTNCGQAKPTQGNNDPAEPGNTSAGNGEESWKKGKELFESGNYSEAHGYIETAAASGIADAALALGYMYYSGLAVEHDLEQALHYFDQATQGGNAEAQWMMGVLLEGRGTEDDLESVVDYYKASADNGYAPAQYSIATFYESGNCIEQSMTDALYYYILAANQENEDAIARLKELGIDITTGISSDEYYDSDRVWADIVMADVSTAFEEAGDGKLYDYDYETGNIKYYLPRDRSIAIAAIADDQWKNVLGFFVSTQDVNLYSRAVDVLCDIASLNEKNRVAVEDLPFSEWLFQKLPEFIDYGRSNRSNYWKIEFEQGGSVEISLIPDGDVVDFEALMYLSDGYHFE